jgi:superfamily II DNA or RNA helicase
VPNALAALLAAVRKACLPGPWSQGVKLARDGAVSSDARRGDTITARVRAPGQPIAPTVTLYLGDDEWSCDCDSPVDPCTHVAATVIALNQAPAPADAPVPVPAATDASAAPAPQVPAAAPLPAPSAHLRYRFDRRSGSLSMRRMIVRPDGSEELLRVSLASPAARGLAGGALLPTHEDVTVDRIVGGRQPGWFPADRVADIFAALASADVRLDGEPVRTSGEVLVPRAVVREEDDGGVQLVIERDPRVSEVVVAGVGRSGDTLHALGETELTGVRLEHLPRKRRFAPADLGQLVNEVLPGLEKRMPVEVKTRRLPRAGGATRPRLQIDLSQRQHTLTVLPSIVYGDPPEARIAFDGKTTRLVMLGDRVPRRDETLERALVGRLRDELHLVPDRRVDFDGVEAVRFAQKLQAWRGDGEPAARQLFGSAPLVPRLDLDGDRFDVSFELPAESEDAADGAPVRRADAAAVIRAWQDGLPLVPLDGGGWAPLPADWLSRYGARVADLLAARRDDGTVETAALPALAELCDDLDCPRPPSLARLAPLLDAGGHIPDAPLPADLAADLRPYQRAGVSWLAFLRDAGLGAVLADDMGLGKTLQALAAVRGRTLVVCPRSVVHNWAAEIRRFRPGLRASIYHGPRRALDPAADVTLTTYAILRLDAEALAKAGWSTLVLDEAQAIKNPDSQVARAAYAVEADFRVALSGTPVENRLDELWSQLHFTNRGLLGGRSVFDERFARPIAAGDPGSAERLRRKIRPFVLRRLKKDVAPELPPRIESILYCELEDQERDVYEAIRAATRKEVVSRLAEGGNVLAALEALLRLRQAACHPSLVPGQFAATSAKVERLVEALEDAAADGHKALVFSQWTSLLDLVEPHLQRAGIPMLRLDGSTRDRAAVVDGFQDEKGPPVMLISLKAGGTGLNLTAADHVFLMDPWWNPAVEDQAADRAHRIGQDKPVTVYRLVAKDTVEEGILVLQERKRKIADAALGSAGEAAGITRADLLALLE